jgi:hypothetical protein
MFLQPQAILPLLRANQPTCEDRFLEVASHMPKDTPKEYHSRLLTV